ncbi:hypothetical protein F4810DRAFT_410118 [Camillea tinctor]|nr:hypothetical protein F4810DRAFT_410118 [Camillea tinctor]
MVGVRRSKGCNTCRRKKVKCDEQKPRCGQCRKGVRVCEGYDQPTIFLNSSSGDYEDGTPSLHGKSKPRFKNHSVDDYAWSNGDSSSHGRVTATWKKKQQRSCRETKRKKTPYVECWSIQRALPAPRCLSSQTWSVDQILGEFLENCLPPSASQEVPLCWIRSLVSMEKDVDALPLAMSALAFGWAGRVDGRPQLVDKGLQLYSAAVRQLRCDIRVRSPLQVLATTAIFTFYELCEFGSEANPGWLYHMAGIAAVLQALGPEMVAVDPYLQVFSFCRMIFIIHGLNRRRRVCAASRMWTHIPFRNHAKSEFHVFFDIAGQVAAWLEKADLLAKDFAGDNLPDEKDFARSGKVLAQAVDLVQKLRRWGKDAQVPLLNGPLRSSDPSSDESSSQRARLRGYPSKLPCQTVATFDNLQGARLMHIYWTVCLTLYMTLLHNPILCSRLDTDDIRKSLFGIDDDELGTPSRSTAPLIEDEAQVLADNIALYGGFCCQNLWQSFGTMVSTFSLRTAIQWYESHGSCSSSNTRGLELQGHCRDLLAVIQTQVEESETARAFQDATFNRDDVLAQRWC